MNLLDAWVVVACSWASAWSVSNERKQCTREPGCPALPAAPVITNGLLVTAEYITSDQI